MQNVQLSVDQLEVLDLVVGNLGICPEIDDQFGRLVLNRLDEPRNHRVPGIDLDYPTIGSLEVDERGSGFDRGCPKVGLCVVPKGELAGFVFVGGQLHEGRDARFTVHVVIVDGPPVHVRSRINHHDVAHEVIVRGELT